MKQSALNLFKWLDRFFGTPLCYFFGAISKLGSCPESKADQVKKIIVVVWIGLGDVILSLPAVLALKKRYPQAQIAYFTTPRGEIVLKGVPEIDKIISYDLTGKDRGVVGFIKMMKALKQEKFDLAVDLNQRYRLPLLMLYWAKIPYRIGFYVHGQGRSWLLTKSTPYPWNKHEVEAFGQVSKLVDAPLENPVLPRLKFPPELTQNEKLDKKFLSFKKPIIIFHIGTGPALKARQWSAENFARLADMLIKQKQASIILTGSKQEKRLAERVQNLAKHHVTDLTGQTTIPELYNLFEKVDLIISLDTGPLHLAAASGTPTLGLFGASDPQKWGPYGQQHDFIYNSRGMLSITAEEVAEKALELIAPGISAELL